MKKFSLRLMVLGLCAQGVFTFVAQGAAVDIDVHAQTVRGELKGLMAQIRAVEDKLEVGQDITLEEATDLRSRLDSMVAQKMLPGRAGEIAQAMSKFLGDPEAYRSKTLGVSGRSDATEKWDKLREFFGDSLIDLYGAGKLEDVKRGLQAQLAVQPAAVQPTAAQPTAVQQQAPTSAAVPVRAPAAVQPMGRSTFDFANFDANSWRAVIIRAQQGFLKLSPDERAQLESLRLAGNINAQRVLNYVK